MFTYLNFNLTTSKLTVIYYKVFREFLDDINEKLLIRVLGQAIVDRNKEVVCKAGFAKLCWLTAEDTLWFANAITVIQFLVYESAVAILAVFVILVKKRK